MSENYKFFQHRECEYFPCHKGVDPDDFNCLFCYCPLYFTEDCGGNHTLSKSGKKTCVGCTFPHKRENYDKLMEKIRDNINKSTDK